MNVLSLFDGISAGRVAFERAGIKIYKYYASEIDKYAEIVSKANYPDIIRLGDVRNIKGINLPKIDILIGGSPCQAFSFAGKRKGMSTKCEIKITSLEQYLELKQQNFEFEGQSYLFWEYVRILKEVKPKYFLLENVRMIKKWENIISNTIGISPIMINSSRVSAQNRKRNYWTNIGAEKDGLFGESKCMIPQPKDKNIFLKDIIEKEVSDKYYLSEKIINNFRKHKERNKANKNGYGVTYKNKEQKSLALTTGSLKNTSTYFIDENKNCLFNIYGDKNYQGGRVYSLDGKSVTLNAGAGGLGVRTGLYIGKYDKKGKLKTNQDKASCFTAGGHSAGNHSDMDIIKIESKNKPFIRRLTPTECERLQTFPDNYTNYISDSQKYKCLGNSWTVDVIAYIFSFISKT